MTVRDILEGRANIAWGMVWGGLPLYPVIFGVSRIFIQKKQKREQKIGAYL